MASPAAAGGRGTSARYASNSSPERGWTFVWHADQSSPALGRVPDGIDPAGSGSFSTDERQPNPTRKVVHMRLTRKAVIATSAAVLAAGVTPALVPGGGDAYARGGPVCLEKFSVHATEDFTWEGDEPYLKVVTDFWHAPGPMDNPSTAAVNVTLHFGDEVKAYATTVTTARTATTTSSTGTRSPATSRRWSSRVTTRRTAPSTGPAAARGSDARATPHPQGPHRDMCCRARGRHHAGARARWR